MRERPQRRHGLHVALPLVACGLLGSVGTPYACDLIVTIDRVKTAQGNVIVRLFAAPDGFPEVAGKSLVSRAVAATSPMTEIRFEQLPCARLAVAAAHDLNGNQRLDFNFIGMPTEPYDFSRNARGTLGPPAFEQAAIALQPAETRTRISLE